MNSQRASLHRDWRRNDVNRVKVMREHWQASLWVLEVTSFLVSGQPTSSWPCRFPIQSYSLCAKQQISYALTTPPPHADSLRPLVAVPSRCGQYLCERTSCVELGRLPSMSLPFSLPKRPTAIGFTCPDNYSSVRAKPTVSGYRVDASEPCQL